MLPSVNSEINLLLEKWHLEHFSVIKIFCIPNKTFVASCIIHSVYNEISILTEKVMSYNTF